MARRQPYRVKQDGKFYYRKAVPCPLVPPCNPQKRHFVKVLWGDDNKMRWDKKVYEYFLDKHPDYYDDKVITMNDGEVRFEIQRRIRAKSKSKSHQNPISNKSITLKELAKAYMDRLLDMKTDAGIIRWHDSDLNFHILPKLGNKKIRDIKPQDLQDFFEISCANKSKSVVDKLLMTLNKLFDYSETINVIENSPLPKAKKLLKDFKRNVSKKSNKKEDVPFSDDELLDLLIDLKQENQYVHNVILTCLHTGMRISECLALRMSDWDKKKNVLNILRQVKHNSGDTLRDAGYPMGKILDKPKYDSVGIAPVSTQLYMILEGIEFEINDGQRKKDMNGYHWDKGGHYYLFPNTKGELNERSSFNIMYKRTLDKINYFNQDKTIHKFRHAFISKLSQQGHELKTIQKLARHHNPITTMGYNDGWLSPKEQIDFSEYMKG